MDISFIILSYKTRELTKNAINSILGLSLPLSYEIIVIDNASGDGIAEMIQNQFLNQNPKPPLEFIALPTNTGYTAGNNVGLKIARGKYILIMNPDIIYSRASDITDILTFMEQRDDVGIVGPKLFNTDGGVQYSCFRFYHLFTPIYRRTFFGKLPGPARDIEQHLMMDFDHHSVREVDWILGSNMFIKRSTLEKIGLLDERFFLYFSDLEYCFRAWDHGLKVIYYPHTKITHIHKRESAATHGLKILLSYTTKIHIQDWMQYLWKYKNRKPRLRPNPT